MRELIKSVIKEETEEIDQNVMNFLLRRHKINEINIDDSIKFKEVYFKVGDDYYGISLWDSRKRQIKKSSFKTTIFLPRIVEKLDWFLI